jgi:prepilin-type N-terminal cleavage/methylation domain-containing protein
MDSGLRTGHRRGFTLTELLVVIGVTAVLMVMLLVPLSRSLELTQRGNATVNAQNSVRRAMQVVGRDVANAVQVYEPRPIVLWGYDAWEIAGKRPRPASGAAPKGYLVENALIAFRLPKHRYFCADFEHYVTQKDLDDLYAGGVPEGVPYDLVAVGDCPRHPGSAVDLKAISPVQPEDRITVYFIGLKDPSLRDDGGNPVYENLLLFRRTFFLNNNTLNTYALYRVDFHPNPALDPGFGNWNMPDGSPNPNFFYDTASAPDGNPYFMHWRSRAIQIMDVETADVVKWAQNPAANPLEYAPQPLVSFGPSAVVDETAQPNRAIGQYALGGSALPPDVPAAEFQVDHGHWTGLASDASQPIPDSLVVSNHPNGTAVLGPRIQVVNPGGGVVFDSQNGIRHRLVSYDSVTGRVLFAVRRRDGSAGNRTDAEYFPGGIEPELNGTALYTVDLTQDAVLSGGMPGGFGSAVAWASANVARAAFLVPGSDEVQVVIGSQVRRLRRAGWSGMPISNYNRYIAPNDLEIDEYAIDYSTGRVTLSESDEAQAFWPTVPPGGVRVAYSFQTNLANDVVRVSYATREAAQVSLGIVEYTRSRQEALPFEVTERVVVRNMKR